MAVAIQTVVTVAEFPRRQQTWVLAQKLVRRWVVAQKFQKLVAKKKLLLKVKKLLRKLLLLKSQLLKKLLQPKKPHRQKLLKKRLLSKLTGGVANATAS